MRLSMNKQAASAHIESDDVAAVNVLNTGERPKSAKKTKIDDFTTLAPARENQMFRKW